MIVGNTPSSVRLRAPPHKAAGQLPLEPTLNAHRQSSQPIARKLGLARADTAIGQAISQHPQWRHRPGGNQMRTTMQPPAGTLGRQRHRRRWPMGVLAVLLVLAAGVYLGGGWCFSGRLYQRGLSGAAKRAAKPTYDLSAVAVAPGTVTLGVPADPDQLLTPGGWGLRWPTGS